MEENPLNLSPNIVTRGKVFPVVSSPRGIFVTT